METQGYPRLKTHRTLYTKKQILFILNALGYDEKEFSLPRKNQAVWLSIAGGPSQRIVKDGNMYAREIFLPE